MYRLLIALALGTFAVGTAGFVTAGILPPISDSFGIDVATAGLLVTVFAIAYALSAPVLAAATGRWPRRVLLMASLAVFVVGVVATFGVALSGPIGAAGIGLVGAHQLGLLAAGLLVLGLLASEIAHRFGRPGKARHAPMPTPADKTVSVAPAKTEGEAPRCVQNIAGVRGPIDERGREPGPTTPPSRLRHASVTVPSRWGASLGELARSAPRTGKPTKARALEAPWPGPRSCIGSGDDCRRGGIDGGRGGGRDQDVGVDQNRRHGRLSGVANAVWQTR